MHLSISALRHRLPTGLLVCMVLAISTTVLVEPCLAAAATFDPTTFNYGETTQVANLDPHRISSRWDWYLLKYVYDVLVGRKDGTLELEPRLATSWEVSDDATVFTFHLRKGVVFHDGTPFNAEAVKFSLERGQQYKLWIVEKLKLIEVLDDLTIRLTLSEPNGLFLYWLDDMGIASLTPGPKPYETGVGTGPYRLSEWVPAVKVIVEKFDEYWGGWEGKHFDKIVRWDISEASVQRLMLEQGDLDMIRLFTARDLDAFRANPDIVVNEHISSYVFYIRLNNAAGPTSDVKVRQALAYAFDFEMFHLVEPTYSTADGPTPSTYLDGWSPDGLILHQDLDKARQLLDEAGYKPGDLKLTYVYPTGVAFEQIAGEIWQAGLAEIGVELEIVNMTWPTLFAQFVSWGETKNPDTAVASYGQLWGMAYPDSYATLKFMYYSTSQGGGNRNIMYYSNSEVDRLSNEAIRTVDRGQRIQLEKEAFQLIADDYPDIFAGNILVTIPLRSWVKGFYPDVLGYPLPLYDMYKELDE